MAENIYGGSPSTGLDTLPEFASLVLIVCCPLEEAEMMADDVGLWHIHVRSDNLEVGQVGA